MGRNGTEDAQTQEGIEKVGERLPEGIDRRTFFKGTVAATVTALAGCAGGGGGGGEETEGSGGEGTEGSGGGGTEASGGGELIGEDVGFRLPIEPTPNYSIAYVAQQNDYWENAGITPLTPEGGNGSGDTTKRIATGENIVGHAAITPQVTGLAQENFDILQFGTTKAMTQSGLTVRTESITDPTDPDQLAGKTITAPDTLAENMWELYRQGIGAPEDITVEYVDTSTAASMIQNGEIDGFWDTINDFAALQAESDVELTHGPLFPIEPISGYYMMVNGTWVEENDNAAEWTRGVLEGYSAAGKWTLLNPEKAIDLQIEQVPALGTQSKESHLRALAAGVAATNFNDGIKENGFGYIDRDVHSNTYDIISDVYDLDTTPDPEASLYTEVLDSAELASFSDDEWSQVREFGSPYVEFFESA